MKRILVIHTGGTISMSEDKDTGKVETNAEHPMHRHQAFIQSLGDITEINPFQVPSPHMNNQYINQLKDIITESIDKDEYDAFVITHGTDTLEETAYLLDLTIDTNLPIILTGAMRSSNEIGSDGLYNYVSALKVASTDEAQNKGVMVVFNDEIHTAKNVTKHIRQTRVLSKVLTMDQLAVLQRRMSYSIINLFHIKISKHQSEYQNRHCKSSHGSIK